MPKDQPISKFLLNHKVSDSSQEDKKRRNLFYLSSVFLWSRQGSNLYLKFRKLLFYPLNYETLKKLGKCKGSKSKII